MSYIFEPKAMPAQVATALSPSILWRSDYFVKANEAIYRTKMRKQASTNQKLPKTKFLSLRQFFRTKSPFLALIKPKLTNRHLQRTLILTNQILWTRAKSSLYDRPDEKRAPSANR
jgi:hypothetical protein